MATKADIGARIGLDGEADFRQALRLSTNEIKTLNTAMTELASRMDKDAKAKEKDAQKTQLLTGKVKAYESQVDLLTGELKTQREEMDKLGKKLSETSSAHGETAAQTRRAREEYVQAAAQVDRLEQKLNGARTGLNQATAELKAHGNELAQWGRRAQEAGDKISTVGNKISGAGQKLSILSGAVLAMGIASGKAAIDFESDFAGVIKTVEATDAELAKLRQDIIDMSLKIPATTKEISGVAEAAGQLGIAVPNIRDFTRVMIDLGNSTDINANEAAMQLAQFANITKMSQGDFDRLGSSVVELGNKLATTESRIVDMAQRIAGAGAAAGYSEADILALAGGFSSLGLEAESGGTAVSKTINQLQTAVETGSPKLEQFAAIAGMTAEEFAKAWGEDAAAATVAFVNGLGDVERNGASATVLMQELGFNSERMSDALRRAAGSENILGEALELSNNAWEKNTALTTEAGRRYGTTASRIEIMKNNVTESARQLGEEMLPAINDFLTAATGMAQKFSALDSGTKKNIITVGKWVAILGPATMLTGKITTGVGNTVTAVGKLTEGTGKLITTAKDAYAATGSVGGAIQGVIGPAGVAGLAIAGVGVALVGLSAAYKKANPELIELADNTDALIEKNYQLATSAAASKQNYDDLVSSIGVNADTARILIGEIDTLAGTENRTAAQTEVLKGKVDELNRLMPELGVQFDDVSGTLNITTSNMYDAVDAMKAMAMQQAALGRQTELYQEQLEIEAGLLDIENQRKKINEQYASNPSDANRIRDLKDLMKSERELLDRKKENADAQIALDNAIAHTSKQTTDAVVEGYKRQGREAGISMATMRQEMADLTGTMVDGYGQQAQAATDSYAQQTQAAEDFGAADQQLKDELKARQDAYAESATNAFQKIDDGSDTADWKMTQNVENMIGTLEHNQQAVTNFADNLTALAERGLDLDFLGELREKGPEQAASAVNDLVNASDEQLERLSEVYADGGKAAREALKTELGLADGEQIGADMIDDVAEDARNNTSLKDASTQQIQDAYDAMEAEVGNGRFKTIGQTMMRDYVDGAIAAWDERWPTLLERVKKGANDIDTTMRNALDEHSPSRKAYKALDDYVDGGLLAVRNGRAKMLTTVGRLGVDVHKTYAKALAEPVHISTSLPRIAKSHDAYLSDAFAALSQPKPPSQGAPGAGAHGGIAEQLRDLFLAEPIVLQPQPIIIGDEVIYAAGQRVEAKRGVRISGAFNDAR